MYRNGCVTNGQCYHNYNFNTDHHINDTVFKLLSKGSIVYLREWDLGCIIWVQSMICVLPLIFNNLELNYLFITEFQYTSREDIQLSCLNKPKWPKPKQRQTETATDWNGHKPKWPRTWMATNQNSHRLKLPQTKMATNRNGHKLPNTCCVNPKLCWFFCSFCICLYLLCVFMFFKSICTTGVAILGQLAISYTNLLVYSREYVHSFICFLVFLLYYCTHVINLPIFYRIDLKCEGCVIVESIWDLTCLSIHGEYR